MAPKCPETGSASIPRTDANVEARKSGRDCFIPGSSDSLWQTYLDRTSLYWPWIHKAEAVRAIPLFSTFITEAAILSSFIRMPDPQPPKNQSRMYKGTSTRRRDGKLDFLFLIQQHHVLSYI